MQLIAESFDLLRSVLGLEPAEIADVFRQWKEGDLESFLIEMTADVGMCASSGNVSATHHPGSPPSCMTARWGAIVVLSHSNRWSQYCCTCGRTVAMSPR